MFKYEIVSQTDIKLEHKNIDKIFKNIHKTINQVQKWTINIVFVDKKSIKKLNKDYRAIDKVTDVLSFHYFSDFSKLKTKEIAWEIVICEEVLKNQALEYKSSQEKEFYTILIHSILHILWYDHEKDIDYEIMSKLENKIYEEVFEK